MRRRELAYLFGHGVRNDGQGGPEQVEGGEKPAGVEGLGGEGCIAWHNLTRSIYKLQGQGVCVLLPALTLNGTRAVLCYLRFTSLVFTLQS